MKTICIYIIFVIISSVVNADVTTLWTRTYNGSANGDDRGNGIAVDISGNVYVTGYEDVTGHDIWIRKYDANGNELWTRTYNGSANSWDEGNGIAVDTSGNVYVTGFETVTEQSYNIWTRKYDKDGNEKWTRTYNGSINFMDIGFGIAVDTSGNVYITGCEYVTLENSYKIWTRKYDKDGNEKWTRTYNGSPFCVGFGIAVDISGNVYVTGYEYVTGQDANIWTRKYDTNGVEKWTQTHNGSANGWDMGSGIAVDTSGNVYVTGRETVTGQGLNIWIRKYDANGNEKWTRTYNGSANDSDVGYGIAVDISGNVYVSGVETVTGQDANIWTRKYDTNGNELWTMTYNGNANGDDYGRRIAVDTSGNVYVTGLETVTGQYWNIWVTKYSQGTNDGQMKDNTMLKIVGGEKGYVNPIKGEVANILYKTTEAGNVTLKIFTMKGKLVKTISTQASGQSQTDNYIYDCKNEDENILSSGIYIVKAEGPGLNAIKKIAIIK